MTTAAIPAEEIADDFRHSLEYLQTPDRYTINNFTVIAKENTEHADAISNVLVEHINKAPPHHKLPALYVLDSIAKNIGTPYTLFLGHKLYGVFLNAYSAVDPNTRKKLDEMLKTWKSPVPGSLDPTPVFPLEYTRKIDNALTQAKTAFLKKHEQSQSQPIIPRKSASTFAATQWRNTPTPPQQAVQYPPPVSQPFYSNNVSSVLQLSQHQQQPNLESLLSNPSQYAAKHQHPNAYVYNEPLNSTGFQGRGPFTLASVMPPSHDRLSTQPVNDISYSQGANLEVLRRDVDQLISSCSADPRGAFAQPQQMSKLDALKALKTLLGTQSLPPDQLAVVRRQVDALQSSEMTDSRNQESAHPSHPGSFLPKNSLPVNYSVTVPTRSVLNEAPMNKPVIDLASLLAQTSGELAMPAQEPIVQASSTAQILSPSISSMLASLAENGVLSHRSQPGNASSVRSTVPSSRASVADLLARATGSMPAQMVEDLCISSASLKISRPNLLKAMIEKRPNQCVNCGLRFASSEDGKARKEQHMDWHFKSNQRIADTSRGIQSRSWFVGELEWIKSKEMENQKEVTNPANLGTSLSGATKALSSVYVSVPSDQEAHQPCPICQERFVTGFNQDIQDWVWLDATQIGPKIYHASCYADLRRDGHDTQERTATPDSVLGKRKAESGAFGTSPTKRPLVGT